MDHLFTNIPFHDIERSCLASASREADRFTEQQLASHQVEELVQAVIRGCVPPRLELHFDRRESSREQIATLGQSPLAAVGIMIPGAGGGVVRGLEISLHIPYSGHDQMLTVTPTTNSSNPPRASVRQGELLITFSGPVDDPVRVKAAIDAQEAELAKWAQWLNADLDALERKVLAQVTAQVNQRRSLLSQGDDLLAALNIPIRRADADQAWTLPIQQRTIAPAVMVSSGSAKREWTLSESIYEQVIGTVTSFTRPMERRPGSANKLIPDEETLRDWLMFVLNTNFNGESTGEVFIGGEVENGAGKTDILVRHEDANVFIGECKFWHGSKKFAEAIDQLLGYVVWRDTKAALILFIKNKDATKVIEDADACLRAHTRFRDALHSDDPAARRDYRFASPQDDRRIISLAFLPVVLPQ